MKKMVCEICESQKIKKENGVFICQECGTEYSVEEAKKLLKEVSENAVDYTESADVSTERNTKIIDNRDQNKGELLKFLLIWANIIKMLEYQKDYKLNLNDFKTWESTDNVGDCISIIHPRKLPFKYERIQTGSSRLENSISYWIDETPLYKSFSNKLMVDPSGSNLSCILLSMKLKLMKKKIK